MTPARLLTVSLLTSVALLPLPAIAQDAGDADAFLDRVAATFEVLGYTIDFGDATMAGDTITVKGFSASLAAMPDADPFTTDVELTFEGVAETEDGGYSAEALTVPTIEGGDDDFAYSLAGIALSDLYFPGGEATMLDGIEMVGGAEAGPFAFSNKGTDLITIDSITADSEFGFADDDAEISSITSTVAVEGITLNLADAPDTEPAVIEAFGDVVTGSIHQQSSWDLTTGDLAISNFDITADNLATLSGDLSITGYTLAVLETMSKMQEESAGMTPEQMQQQQATAGMALLAQLGLGGISLRLDDASLTNKVLTLISDMQGAKVDDFTAGLEGMLAAVLPPALGDEFNGEIKDAVATFLADPQSLYVAIAPATPVNFAVLMMSAGQPQMLIDMLNVTISANDTDMGVDAPDAMSADEAPVDDAAAADEESTDRSKDKVGN
ncbi:MAG: hypothetical protein JWR75_827 [Devosia sp.]|nr:hypothetical protein [Devosia sp.]